MLSMALLAALTVAAPDPNQAIEQIPPFFHCHGHFVPASPSTPDGSGVVRFHNPHDHRVRVQDAQGVDLGQVEADANATFKCVSPDDQKSL